MACGYITAHCTLHDLSLLPTIAEGIRSRLPLGHPLTRQACWENAAFALNTSRRI